MDGTTYNVTGSPEALVALKIAFPTSVVDERFSKRNWNLAVPEDREDDFQDYCEKNEIQYEAVY